MRKTIIVLIFELLTLIVFPENNDKNIDSLLNALQNKTKSENNSKIYNDLSEFYYNLFLSNESYYYAKKALSHAAKENNSSELARSYFNIGQSAYVLGSFNESLLSFKKAIIYYQSRKNNKKIFLCYKNIASVYKSTGRIDKVFDYYYRSLKLAEITNDYENIIGIYSVLISMYNELNDFDNMLKFIIKSKHFLKGKKIEERNYPNIRLYEGLYYNNCIHNEKKALLLIESSLNEYISKNDLAGIASTYSLLGDMFTNKNILDKAMSYYKRALNIRIQSDDKNSMSILWTNIAHVYMLKKDYNNALKCNFKSFKVRLRTGNKQLIASSYANIGSTYIKMRHYDRALIYLNKGLLLARELGVNLYIKNSYKKLFELFYEQKNYQKALEYHQLLSDIMLKIAKEENNRKIAEIQSKYENEKKQQQLKNLSKQNSIQKLILRKRQNLVYGLSFSFILIILLAILYSRHNKLKSAQKTLELEQKLLRSQMNPHFIFNSLSSIQSYILKNDLFEAGKYLSGFAKLIRLVLTNSREEFIPLENEIQTLKLYLLLQTLRFENKFDYSFEIDPAIDPEKKYIPPMLIQPLVENAIDHGILNKQDKGNIFIRIFMGNEIMQIEVEDNGIGRKKANLIQEQNKSLHKSLSTKITNERIQLLNKKYKLGIRLTIYDLHDKEGIASGTLVRIIIPSKRLKFIIKNRDFVLFSLLSKSYRSNKM